MGFLNTKFETRSQQSLGANFCFLDAYESYDMKQNIRTARMSMNIIIVYSQPRFDIDIDIYYSCFKWKYIKFIRVTFIHRDNLMTLFDFVSTCPDN
jgi:hypothetical protein